MSDLLSAIKSEITRLARKEVKKAMSVLQSTVSRQRKEIGVLKSELAALKRSGRSSGSARATTHPGIAKATSETGSPKRRFSAPRLAKQREKLGLSAADFGRLIGVAAQTVYSWENGLSRPRAAQLESIARVRGMSKAEREAVLLSGAPRTPSN